MSCKPLVRHTGPQPTGISAPTLSQVPLTHEYRERYGAVSPVPGHDGTECFAWDSALWGFAEHFRVRGQAVGQLRVSPWCVLCAGELCNCRSTCGHRGRV